MNLIDLNEYLKNESNTLDFLLNHKMIFNVRSCSVFHDDCLMTLIKNNTAKGGYIWKCPVCSRTRTFFSESIFQDSKLQVSDILKIIYCWSYDFSVRVTSKETNVSCHTISALFSQLKRACYEVVESSIRKKIGGVQMTVEIDETMLTKRKYHRGRVLNEQWVFGGICRESNEIFLDLIPNRTSETLLSIVSRSIQYGTTIISDSWKGYSFLDEDSFPQPYLHESVNHSKNFINPETGANTQKEERLWRELKEKKKRMQGIPRDDVDLYLSEFWWKREMKLQRKDLFISSCEMLSQISFKKIE